MKAARQLATTLIMAGAMALPSIVFADHHDERARGQRGGEPSAAMQAACKGKAPGASVTVTAQDGRKLAGTCQLVFRPDAGSRDNKR
ncbi:hypothetical protein [Amnimonas aquatica]|uniref:Uncharacterized protein n=1 Tax=Amnimonas aquatica TaxID=2094561 RepID=A0A2P6ASE8_9GAMM|nr:hypothetical protein [Amnimonas aquatica]PQA42219.1 hypothetical protein C5O18_06065 [Amnimonas aquatica]